MYNIDGHQPKTRISKFAIVQQTKNNNLFCNSLPLSLSPSLSPTLLLQTVKKYPEYLSFKTPEFHIFKISVLLNSRDSEL